jgi:hypothetical protein
VLGCFARLFHLQDAQGKSQIPGHFGEKVLFLLVHPKGGLNHGNQAAVTDAVMGQSNTKRMAGGAVAHIGTPAAHHFTILDDQDVLDGSRVVATGRQFPPFEHGGQGGTESLAHSGLGPAKGPVVFVRQHDQGAGIAAIVHQQPATFANQRVTVPLENNQLIDIANRSQHTVQMDDAFLGLFALADVAKGQHNPQDIPCFVPDGRPAVVDGHLAAAPFEQHRMVGQPGHHAALKHLAGRVVHRRPGVLIDNVKHLLHRLSGRLGHTPAGQRFGHGIDKGNAAPGIGCNHRVANAGQGDAQPLALLAQFPVGLMHVQGQLDLNCQFALLERLEDIAERPGQFGALKRCGIRMGGQKDHRQIVPPAFDDPGRFNAVHGALQLDIHQHQVRAQVSGKFDSRPAFHGDRGGLVSEPS